MDHQEQSIARATMESRLNIKIDFLIYVRMCIEIVIFRSDIVLKATNESTPNTIKLYVDIKRIGKC